MAIQPLPEGRGILAIRHTKRKDQFSVHWPNKNSKLILSESTLDNLVNLILDKFFEEKE